MTFIKKTIGFSTIFGLIIFALIAVSPIQVRAQVGGGGGNGIPGGNNPPSGNSYQIQNPAAGVGSLSDFVSRVLDIALKVGIPIVALAIIYSGFAFVAARGSAEKLEKAKSRLLYTVIGAAILLGAWIIATVIKATIEAIMA